MGTWIYTAVDNVLTSLLQEQETQPSGFWRIRDGGQSKMVEKLWEYSCQGWGWWEWEGSSSTTSKFSFLGILNLRPTSGASKEPCILCHFNQTFKPATLGTFFCKKVHSFQWASKGCDTWRIIALPELSSMIATSHVWLFKFNYQCLSYTSYLSDAH